MKTKKVVYKNSRLAVAKQFSDFLFFKPVSEMMTFFLEKAEWPQRKETYWYIDTDGEVRYDIWWNEGVDNDLKAFGNCFRTEKQAIEARDKIREVLKELKVKQEKK